MELLARIAQVIVPVFLIVAIGYTHARRARPEMIGFKRIVLDVLSPLICTRRWPARSSGCRSTCPCCTAARCRSC